MVSNAPAISDREFDFSDRDFRFLSRLANEQTGIVLAEHKRDMVYSRLARRLRALGLTRFSDYCDYLKSAEGQDELGNLVNAITTNLTHFFREPHHFNHLRDHVLKPLAASTGEKKLRIWSAACSSGMEPYSIAMTLRAILPRLEQWDAKILATDIDTNMLKAAMAGQYSASELPNIPAAYRDGITDDDEYIYMPESLKALIAFKHLNLLQPWPMKGLFDAVFCRNVVIYFDKPTQAKLFTRMADRIKPGGWLYIGHSETLNKVCDRFELVGRTLYRRVA